MSKAKLFGAVVLALVLLPSGVEAQQGSVQVSARVVSRIETQRVVTAPTVEAGLIGGGEGVPASWRWEIRAGTAGKSADWGTEPIAAGQGGEAALSYAMDADAVELSYLFAPL